LLKLKVIGYFKYFLGLEIAHSTKGLSVSQINYTLTLLENSGFFGCKPASLLMDPNLKLSAAKGDLLLNFLFTKGSLDV
jgi:hypothetical protein